MKKVNNIIKIGVLLLAIGLSSCFSETKKESEKLKSSLNLVFKDDFDAKDLDTLKWKYFSSNPAPYDKILPRGNCDYKNAAILQLENSSVENGILNLIAKHEPQTYEGLVDVNEGQLLGCDLYGGENFSFDQKYTSASIFGRKGYDHGYFECRAKIPCAYGLYPVFWLWHHDEIVVFEFFGVQGNHFVSSHNKRKYVTKKFSHTNYCDDFHTYAVYWTNEKITWFFDEQQLWTICRDEQLSNIKCKSNLEPDNKQYDIKESFPDSTDRWLIPNISLRIYEWTEKVGIHNKPDTLKIDYVTIYQEH